MILQIFQLFVVCCRKSLRNGGVLGDLICERDQERRSELKRLYRSTGVEFLISFWNLLFAFAKLIIAIYIAIEMILRYILATFWAILWANGKF